MSCDPNKGRLDIGSCEEDCKDGMQKFEQTNSDVFERSCRTIRQSKNMKTKNPLRVSNP